MEFFTGLDYLTQAIKSWETALDSIENAAYMQSQVRALPVCKLNDISTISALCYDNGFML